jgi:hypothetical protein
MPPDARFLFTDQAPDRADGAAEDAYLPAEWRLTARPRPRLDAGFGVEAPEPPVARVAVAHLQGAFGRPLPDAGTSAFDPPRHHDAWVRAVADAALEDLEAHPHAWSVQ